MLMLDRSNWKTFLLDEVLANINDYFQSARDGELPYVAGPHIGIGDATITRYGSTADDDFPPTFKRKFQTDDVLLHSRGIEKLATVDRAGVTGEKLFVLRSKDETILSQQFVVWLLQSPAARRHLRDNFTGSVNKFLNWKPLAAMKIDLPPVDEQRRIANLLWTLDLHKSSVEAVSASLGTAADRLVADELRQHEDSSVPLPKLIDEMKVGVVVKPAQYYTDEPSGVPALRGLNIKPGGFVLDDLVHFNHQSATDLSKSTLRRGDVVIVRTGRPGDAAVVTAETEGYNCIDLIITRPGKGILPDFFALYLNSSYGRAQIARLSAGTAQQHFNLGALKKLTIPSLSVLEQGEIMARVDAVRQAQLVVDDEAAVLATLRSSLLVEIFGGN